MPARLTLTRAIKPLVAVAVALVLPACAPAGDGVTLFKSGHFREAHPLLELRAESGDPIAGNYLGIQYYLGLGVPKNPQLAAHWFESAAHQGDASAQLNLGMLYLNGYGVSKDHERAFGWLQAARDGGNSRAQNYLAILTDNLTPNQMVRGRAKVKERIKSSTLPGAAR